MNKTAMANKELELKRDQLDWKKKSDRRDRATKLGAAALKAAGSMFKLQDPAWYKRMIGGSYKPSMLPTYFVQGLAGSWPDGNHLDSYTTDGGDVRIAVVNYVNTIGFQESTAAGQYPSDNDVHFALTYLYAQSLQNNSRVPDEEAAEYGLYLLCWTDVYALLHRVRLALDVAEIFSDQNRAYGRKLVQAMGFNYNDLISNRANYIGQLNVLIQQANENSAIPADFGYLKRKLYLADTILRDMSNSELGSLTLFRQMYYWKFDVLNNATTHWSIGKAGSMPIRISEVFIQIRDMLAQLSEATVAHNIKSNLLSAIPHEKFYKMKAYEGKLKEIFVDSDEPRTQLMNMMTLPSDTNITPSSVNLHVTDNGYLIQGSSSTEPRVVFETKFKAPSTNGQYVLDKFESSSHTLNFYKDDVSEDDILTSTRFKFTCTYAGPSSGNAYLLGKIASCGVEVVCSISLFDGATVADTSQIPCVDTYTYVLNPKTIVNGSSYVTESIQFNVMQSVLLTQINWSPLIYISLNGVVDGTLTTGSHSYVVFGDIGKNVHISKDNITVLNSQCNKSLFALPADTFKQGF